MQGCVFYLVSLVLSSLSEVAPFFCVGLGAREDQKMVPRVTAGDTRPQEAEPL